MIKKRSAASTAGRGKRKGAGDEILWILTVLLSIEGKKEVLARGGAPFPQKSAGGGAEVQRRRSGGRKTHKHPKSCRRRGEEYPGLGGPGGRAGQQNPAKSPTTPTDTPVAHGQVILEVRTNGGKKAPVYR